MMDIKEIVGKTKEIIKSITYFQRDYCEFMKENKIDYSIRPYGMCEIIEQIRELQYYNYDDDDKRIEKYYMETIHKKLWQFKNDSDWQEIFRTYVNPVQNGANAIHEPLKDYNTNNLRIDEVNEIIAISNGENDGKSWIGLFKIRYKYYLMVRGWCDYTGWDCQADGDAQIAQDLDLLKKYSITPEEKRRLFGNE